VAAHHGTEAETILIALLDLAAIGIENSNACHSKFNSEVGLYVIKINLMKQTG